MSSIYKSEDKYYKMIEKPGTSYNRNRKIFKGYRYYALWRPMISIKITSIWSGRFIQFFIPNYFKKKFYLDDSDFEPLNTTNQTIRESKVKKALEGKFKSLFGGRWIDDY